MEFWPEDQGQSPLNSKFDTVPGRNCTHTYHDRHQVHHHPLYYGEQQGRGRESRHWSAPGSRAGGTPQVYSNWTEQEPAAPSCFPFILDRHTQQQQDSGDREWAAAQRAAREYESGLLREGWQRRLEPCGPLRYNREVSAKRSDSSHRELEAWAARYSHSLPRRRRIEAELRGAARGLLESSRSGTDPRAAALQQVRQSPNIRESGLWCERGSRQQAHSYYASQTPASDSSHVLDMKEKAHYQRRMFSQPPGYIAPPPYDSPHKGSPVLHHCDSSWEQKGKRQSIWSQPTLRKQDVPVDMCDHRKEQKEEFAEPDVNQEGFLELEGLQQRQRENNASHAISPFNMQENHIQLYVQQPQVLKTVENKKINENLSSKVIEGREFRLNKKAGGMTIFCLVSRIASTTETSSMPLRNLQTNTILGGIPISINQTHKLADEVDFRAPPGTGDGRNVEAKQKETPTRIESESLEVNLSEKGETDNVSSEKANTSDADSTFERTVAHSVHSVSLKYPLWREPSITSRAENENSSTCLKANSEEGESNGLPDQERTVHPIDVEVRRLDIKTDVESEDSKGLLVIDTTCVVVKMEMIPSPKKQHVHSLHTEHSQPDTQTTVSPECVQSNGQLNQEETTDHHCVEEKPESKVGSDFIEKKAPDGQKEIPSCCVSSSSDGRETLKERAERILGIPLQDCIANQRPEEATSLLDSCVENQEVEPSPIEDNNIEKAVKQIQEATREEELSRNRTEVDQTKHDNEMCLQENYDAKKQVANEGASDFSGVHVQVSTICEVKDAVSQLKTGIKNSPENEMNNDDLLKPVSEENNTCSHPSQCHSPPNKRSDSSSFPSSQCEALSPSLTATPPSSDPTPLMHILESNKEEGRDTQLPDLISAQKLALHRETSSLPHTSSFLQSVSTSSSSHTNDSPRPSVLDLVVVEGQEEECETLDVINNQSEALKDFAKDMTEELMSQQQSESGQADNSTFVKENNVTNDQQTEEPDKDPRDYTVEQTLNIEDPIEVHILQQQLECAHAEDVALVKEPYMSEEQLPKEDKDNITDHLEQTMSGKKVNILPEQFNNKEESFITEEKSKKESDKEQELSTENATDSQIQADVDILQDIESETEPSNSSPPSQPDSDQQMFQSPFHVFTPSDLPSPPHTLNKSDAEFVLLLHSACPSALNPDADPAAGIRETDPHLDICEESLPFSPFSHTFPPPIQPSSSSTPPYQGQEEGGEADPDLPLKEEPQYPVALWDAVNRIRKHTAPDSENEEEEVGELSDPESVGEDLRCLGVVVGVDSESIVLDREGRWALSKEESVEGDVELGLIQDDPCHAEPSGRAEDDTLSCSSTSSHSSGDTVIVADEDEETPPDARTDSTTGDDVEFLSAEGERCCSAEVKGETATMEEGDGHDSVTNVSVQSEDRQVEVTSTTTEAVKMMERERE
uniref:uncharacterized protein si:ch211-159e12.5 n=1 Tax=Gasterosteus aculeatus aculeatus TaxID=481459 RepID=UPI001A99E1A7|nr:uncharacterized protein si:ch211-159e12.5 [Gasterosteus aculeatus aculeatus]XP_040059399.1 uncharacterized protein si:ch211-159e12.5 [Gasterosteus aculeatus aculeatus]